MGPYDTTYADSYTCPPRTSRLYGADGKYTATINSTAIVTSGGAEEDRDTATTTVDCYLPAMAKVIKVTEEGPANIGQFPFIFKLYDPDDVLVETKTLSAAGNVTFDYDIKTEGEWTIVEILPEGWISLDDSLECTFEVDFWDDAGETFTCTFHNREMGQIVVVKRTYPISTQQFAFDRLLPSAKSPSRPVRFPAKPDRFLHDGV